jgi:hypothetical protein
MIAKFLDKNGLIKPQESWQDSGNGVFYTAVAIALDADTSRRAMPWILKCLDEKRGVLMRTPDNQFGLESHDNWLGMLTLALDYPELGRKLSWWMIKRLGFMQNVPGKFGASQMFRFPHLWPLVLANLCAFKPYRYLCGLYMKLVSSFDKIDIGNKSGTQLSFYKRHAMIKLGLSSDPMRKFLSDVAMATEAKGIHSVMVGYYSEGHVISEGYLSYDTLVRSGFWAKT